jgi:Fungal protein kinase
VISLFYALGFASASTSLKGLGWDPTVERIYVGGKMQYKFTVGDEVFTTTRELATYGAHSMVGRGTRVYEATDAKGETVAIKDSWREIDRQSEGEIVEKILASCEKKLGAEDFADAKRHFVGVRLWKDVTIDDVLDETVNPVAGDEYDGTWKWKHIDISPILSERLHLSATGDVPDSSKLSTFLPAQLGIVRQKETRIPQRVHARIVFHDVGVTVKDLVLISLADTLSCLSGGLKGTATILILLTSIAHATLRPILFA